jgi:Ras-related protein Rab-8A
LHFSELSLSYRGLPNPYLPQIDTARGQALADEYGLRFFETSAKDGTHVIDAFQAISKDCVSNVLSAVVDGSTSLPAAKLGPSGSGLRPAGASAGKEGKCLLQ